MPLSSRCGLWRSWDGVTLVALRTLTEEKEVLEEGRKLSIRDTSSYAVWYIGAFVFMLPYRQTPWLAASIAYCCHQTTNRNNTTSIDICGYFYHMVRGHLGQLLQHLTSISECFSISCRRRSAALASSESFSARSCCVFCDPWNLQLLKVIQPVVASASALYFTSPSCVLLRFVGSCSPSIACFVSSFLPFFPCFLVVTLSSVYFFLPAVVRLFSVTWLMPVTLAVSSAAPDEPCSSLEITSRLYSQNSLE